MKKKDDLSVEARLELHAMIERLLAPEVPLDVEAARFALKTVRCTQKPRWFRWGVRFNSESSTTGHAAGFGRVDMKESKSYSAGTSDPYVRAGAYKLVHEPGNLHIDHVADGGTPYRLEYDRRNITLRRYEPRDICLHLIFWTLQMQLSIARPIKKAQWNGAPAV
jgi:hypothetical protein